MLTFAKIISIIFSFLYILGVIAPFWIRMSWWQLLIYVLAVSALFILITSCVSHFVSKRNKNIFWFQYLDSKYTRKLNNKFTNDQYIDAIGVINSIYDDKSPLLSKVENADLLKRKNSLSITLESGKLSYINLVPIFVSAILSFLLPLIQKTLSPEFDAEALLSKLEEMLVSNVNTDVILSTIKNLLPTDSVQINWSFTACLLTIFFMVSVELIKIKAPDLRSECIEYEIKKIESQLQKSKSKKSYDEIILESAYMDLKSISGAKKNKAEATESIKDFLVKYDALDNHQKKKLTKIMQDSQLYESIFKKTDK